MGIRYSVDGPEAGYLVTCVKKSSLRYGLQVRKQRYLGLVDEKEARRVYRELQRDVELEVRERESTGVSWGNLLGLWYRDVVLADVGDTVTSKNIYDGLRMHTKPWCGLGVDKLSTLSFQMIVNDMVKKGLSRGRVRAIKCAVNKVFEWGILNRMIPPTIVCPTRGAKLPSSIKKDKPVLNMNEVRYMLQRAQDTGHEYFHVWAVAFETGCRSGELWALKWSDIDFQRREITVSRSFNFKLNKVKGTKTGSTRVLPISKEFEPFLKNLKLQTGITSYVLPRISSWQSGQGAAVTRKFCKNIGIPEIPFHGTRACFATICLSNGESIPKVMAAGGWGRISSFQHYVRLLGTSTQGVTDKLQIIPTDEVAIKTVLRFASKKDKESHGK